MQRTPLFPLAAALFLAAACTDTGKSPVAPPAVASWAVVPDASGGGGNPHFIKHATDVSRVGDNLVAVFKESGLASGAVETVQLSAVGSATYQCVNGGGNVPSDPKKTTVSTLLTVSGTFTADQNGNISGSLTLGPPGPGGFTCPPGQDVSGPTDVSYTNVTLTDLTSGATFSFPGTF